MKVGKLTARWLVMAGLFGLVMGQPLRTVAADVSAQEAANACRAIGAWVVPSTGANLSSEQILASVAAKRIVLLGESHDSEQDHRWQLHTLAGLHAHRSQLIVGFEMFPRAVQPELDAWSQGKHEGKVFLEASRWREVWGYDPELYLPLFHFVRQNRLPMTALNVERDLVSRVGREGWKAIPEADRQSLSDPAPASDEYRRALAEVYAEKLKRGVKAGSKHGRVDLPHARDTDETPDLSSILESEEFSRFVDAQLTWDRAMAEALYEASREAPEALVIGILGRGHIEHGYGVPHQLADLGEDDVAVLLPVDSTDACGAIQTQIADAIFVLDPREEPEQRKAKPRLGVLLEQADQGVQVLEVMESSVAEAMGVLPGDVIVSAATFPVERITELVEIVQRQAPGTWLPIELKRDGVMMQLIAKFPSRFE